MYHRLGQPGGPAARVEGIAVRMSGPGREQVDGELFAAEDGASEVEWLRAVCSKLDVTWGHDDLGWWAVITRPTAESHPEP